MTDELRQRTQRLRAAFDRTFAGPPVAQPPTEALLAVVAGGARYALRMSEISELVSDRVVIAVPSPVAELRGVVGVRAEVIAVYDLAALLGHARAEAPRWLAVCGEGGGRAALAFDGLDGHLRVARADVHAAADRTHAHLIEVVRIDAETRPIVSVPALLDTLSKKCAASRAAQER